MSQESIEGASVFDIIIVTLLNTEIGRSLKNKLNSISEIVHQIQDLCYIATSQNLSTSI